MVGRDGRFDLDGVLLDGCADLLGTLLDRGTCGLRLALYGLSGGLGAAGNGLAGLLRISFDDNRSLLGVPLDLASDVILGGRHRRCKCQASRRGYPRQKYFRDPFHHYCQFHD